MQGKDIPRIVVKIDEYHHIVPLPSWIKWSRNINKIIHKLTINKVEETWFKNFNRRRSRTLASKMNAKFAVAAIISLICMGAVLGKLRGPWRFNIACSKRQVLRAFFDCPFGKYNNMKASCKFISGPSTASIVDCYFSQLGPRPIRGCLEVSKITSPICCDYTCPTKKIPG